ncbi:MAG: hypothetical protein RR315_02405, partial [Oscillospiraceae bacterium]
MDNHVNALVVFLKRIWEAVSSLKNRVVSKIKSSSKPLGLKARKLLGFALLGLLKCLNGLSLFLKRKIRRFDRFCCRIGVYFLGVAEDLEKL